MHSMLVMQVVSVLVHLLLTDVKEISNCILGGGKSTLDDTFPTGIFPDGPEVLAVRVTNIAGGFGSGSRSADFKFSWTEAQA